jgi:hypothetical protein
MNPMPLDKVRELLGIAQIPGTAGQITALCIRIRELSELNGEDWVRRNSRKLLDEWQSILALSPRVDPGETNT